MSDDTPDRYLKIPVKARVGDGGEFQIGEIVVDLEEMVDKYGENVKFVDSLEEMIKHSTRQLPDIFRKFADDMDIDGLLGALGIE